MKFHERLKALREETGMNQKDFAASLNMQQSKYNKWERGMNSPDYDSICELADTLNVTVDFLLGHSDNPQSAIATSLEEYGLTDTAAANLLNIPIGTDKYYHQIASEIIGSPHFIGLVLRVYAYVNAVRQNTAQATIQHLAEWGKSHGTSVGPEELVELRELQVQKVIKGILDDVAGVAKERS